MDTGPLDLRPRLILHPPGGAVVVLIDPTSWLGGTVTLPGLGVVPYELTPGFPTVLVTLHAPTGDLFLSVDLTATGGSDGTVPIPGLGNVPYEVVLGPPDIPSGSLFGAGWLVPAVLILGAVLLFKGR